MDPKKGVSWPTVCYMLGEVQYGGRVTDDFDKRLLTTFTQVSQLEKDLKLNTNHPFTILIISKLYFYKVWFCDVLLRPGFEFYKGYKVPQTRNLQGYIDYINSLPATDSPEVFGLHSNADITYQINTAKGKLSYSYLAIMSLSSISAFPDSLILLILYQKMIFFSLSFLASFLFLCVVFEGAVSNICISYSIRTICSICSISSRCLTCIFCINWIMCIICSIFSI